MTIVDGIIEATFPSGLRNTPAEHAGYVYLTNGWTRMRRWGGNYARRSDWSGADEYEEVPYAGIEGPSQEAGVWTTAPTESAASAAGWTRGTHLFRYRWKDSRTGYVSNPSAALEYTVTAASKKLTFTMAATGSVILRPTDAKADQYVLEATTAGGSDYFLVDTKDVIDSAGAFNTTWVVEISDAELADSYIPWDDAGDRFPGQGHGLPPVKRYCLSHRGRLWLFGDVIYDTGTVTVAINSTSVTGSGTAWTEDALGTTSEPPVAGRRLFRANTFEYYEIAAYVSATALTLDKYYGSTGASAVTYEIVSQNTDIYVSRADFPESFPPDATLALPTGSNGGRICAGVGFEQGLVFFTDRSTFRFTYDLEPSQDGAWYPVPGDRGAIGQRLVLVHDGRIYAMDRRGVWMYSGGIPVDISSRVESFFGGTSLDWSTTDKWHVAFVPRARAIRFFVVASGDTEPELFLQYDPLRGTWTTGYYDAGQTESHLGWISRSNPQQYLLGDANGHTWFGDYGTCDGPAAADCRFTVLAGSTASLVGISPSITTSDMRGSYAYWVQGGETRLILGSSTSALIMSSAFSQAPSTGDTIWVGRIQGKLKSKAFYPSRVGPQGRATQLAMRFFYRKTTSSRKVAIRFYRDLSASAITWDTTSLDEARDNVALPGATTGYAATDWVVDTSLGTGYAEIPIGLEEFRCLEFEIESLEPDTALEIWGVEIEGVEARGDL